MDDSTNTPPNTQKRLFLDKPGLAVIRGGSFGESHRLLGFGLSYRTHFSSAVIKKRFCIVPLKQSVACPIDRLALFSSDKLCGTQTPALFYQSVANVLGWATKVE
ncbi:hypothetical protein TNCV_104181 [Trichonephila clavipes]|nr:hypothetical protein TNCV_104181 [Trichonephila clavipes]